MASRCFKQQKRSRNTSKGEGFMNQTRSSAKNAVANCWKWELNLWWLVVVEASTFWPRVDGCEILHHLFFWMWCTPLFMGFQHVSSKMVIAQRRCRRSNCSSRLGGQGRRPVGKPEGVLGCSWDHLGLVLGKKPKKTLGFLVSLARKKHEHRNAEGLLSMLPPSLGMWSEDDESMLSFRLALQPPWAWVKTIHEMVYQVTMKWHVWDGKTSIPGEKLMLPEKWGQKRIIYIYIDCLSVYMYIYIYNSFIRLHLPQRIQRNGVKEQYLGLFTSCSTFSPVFTILIIFTPKT